MPPCYASLLPAAAFQASRKTLDPPTFFRLDGRPVRSALESHGEVCLDQCCFGALSKKPTLLQYWHCDMLTLQQRCDTKKSICSTSGNAHLRLSGVGADKQFLTTAAAKYPAHLAAALAKALHQGVVAKHSRNIWSMFAGGLHGVSPSPLRGGGKSHGD